MSLSAAKSAFCDYLIEEGILTDEEVKDALEMQKSMFLFGVLAIRNGYLEKNQLGQILQLQAGKFKGLRIGEIALQQGLMDVGQVENILRDQIHSVQLLGEILVSTKKITNQQLDDLLEEFVITSSLAIEIGPDLL